MAQLIRAIKQEDEVGIWRQLAQADVDSIVNDQSSEKSETPLFCASMKGNVDVVRNLLEKGAKVELKTSWGATPLHAASERGHLNVVKILVSEGSPLNDQTRFGDTAAHLAAYRGHLKIVKCLVEAGTDLFLKNSERRTLLDEASVAEHGKVVRYLESVMFGADSKPTPWRTPYSRHSDPMTTTNLMQPNDSSPPGPPVSPKSPVGRSHSSPVFLEQDKNRRVRGLTAGIRHKLHNVSFDEVINHPTVRLSVDSNILQQPDSGVDTKGRNRGDYRDNARLGPSYDNEGRAIPRIRESFPPRRHRDKNYDDNVRFETDYEHDAHSATHSRESFPPRRNGGNNYGGNVRFETDYAAHPTTNDHERFPRPVRDGYTTAHEQAATCATTANRDSPSQARNTRDNNEGGDRLEPSYEHDAANANRRVRENSEQRSGSDGICGGNSSSQAASACKHDCERLRARSLEKVVTELQCGLSYTQEELSRTKAGLKAAKEQIDRVCAAQTDAARMHSSSRPGENRRLYLRLRDVNK